MRILMTVSSALLMDGINRHVLLVSSALNTLEGVEIGVVTLHPWSDFNDALKRVGVKCWSLDCANGHQLTVIPRFCRVMREFNPDIVHEHVTAFFEGMALKWLFPWVKRVVTIHGICDPVQHASLRDQMLHLLGRDIICRFLAQRCANAYIYISQGVRAEYPQSAVPSFVVYNPMLFNPCQHVCHKDGKLIVGTACRVEAVKDPLAFTRVIGEVTKRMKHVEGWIIGDGSLLAECKELAAAEGYVGIKFWGMRNDAKDLIAQMDCFVLTSRREGMPGALLEAMSVKTPIAFMEGEGGLQDLVGMSRSEGPFAVIAERGDEATMVKGVCDLLKDKKKATMYAEKAFGTGKCYFDLSVVAQQVKDVYEKCRKED